MVVSAKKRARDDLYPASDDMGEHEIQRLIAELLRPLLALETIRVPLIGRPGTEHRYSKERQYRAMTPISIRPTRRDAMVQC